MMRTFLVVLWSVVLGSACSSPGTSSTAECLAGARGCDGNRVITCLDGQYTPGQLCSGGMICTDGACVLPAFADAKSDTEPTDTVDTVQDIAPDVKPDAKPDVPPDVQKDAAKETVQDVTQDVVDVIDVLVDIAPDVPPPDVQKDVPILDLMDQPFNPGPLKYERLANTVTPGNLRKLAWFPDGTFALILAPAGQVLRYDVTGTALQKLTVLGQDVVDLAIAPAGNFFLLLGTDTVGNTRLWRGAVDSQGGVTFTEESTLTGGDPVALTADPAGSGFVIATRKSSPSVDTLSFWQDGKGVTASQAFNALGGIWDVMWVGQEIPGLPAVVTSHGLNGADSRTWVIGSPSVVSNGWSPGFGNGGGAAWRPGGNYGIVTGWSSNVVYVFDGNWQSTTLPGVNNGAAPQAVGWNAEGTRALVVGRATGSVLAATVSEHRPGKTATYPASVWIDQSISNFAASPWNGNLNTLLLDVAWRPNSVCDEGLIVGTDSPASQPAGYGLLIRFYDANDPACAASP